VPSYLRGPAHLWALHADQELGFYSEYAQITQSRCAEFMRARCAAGMQNQTLMMHAAAAPGSSVVPNQTVAAFLIARSPVSFIGFGWPSRDSQWDEIFLLQAGEPMEVCREESPGVFSRRWTRGTAKLSCNTWEATLPFEALS